MATPTTLANLQNVLRYLYPDKQLHRVFNNRRILNAKLEKRKVETDEGLNFRYNVHTGGTAAGGFIKENGTLYDPQAQKTDWLIFNAPSYAHRVMLSGQAKHANKRGKGATVKLWEFQVNRAVQDARDDFAIANYTPMNGLLTKARLCVSNTTNAVVEVEDVSRLRKGQKLAVATYDGADTTTHGHGPATNQDGMTIDAIDPRTRRVTFTGETLSGTPITSWVIDPATGVSDYAFFDAKSFQEGNRAFGLEDIISEDNPVGTGAVNYGGVNRSTAGNEWARGNVMDLAGDSITDDKADEAIEMVERLGYGTVEYWVTTHKVYREIKKNAVQTKRTGTLREKIANMWFEKCELSGKPVYSDKYGTPGAIYGIDPQAMWIAEVKAAGWEDEDGQTVTRLENTWGYQSLLTRMYQLVAIPNCHVVIKNVKTQSYIPSS